MVSEAKGLFEEIASYIGETVEDFVAVESGLFRKVLGLGRALFQAMVSRREAEEARERESGPPQFTASRAGYLHKLSETLTRDAIPILPITTFPKSRRNWPLDSNSK